MNDPAKNPFDPFFAEIRQIVREEIAAALDKKQPAKLQYTLEEAAQRLNVKASLLNSKVREGLPHHRIGRRIYFTEQDIALIDQKTANGGSGTG